MSPLLKNSLIALGLAIILFIGVYLYINNSDSILITSNRDVSNKALLETQNFLQRLRGLREVQLNDTLFNDENFRSLTNFRREVHPELIGRSNPFVPTE